MSLQSAMLSLQPEMLQQQRGMEKSSKLGMLQLLARLQAPRGITPGHRRYTRCNCIRFAHGSRCSRYL